MANRKKKTAELEPQEDPRAPLDAAALLAAAKPVLAALEADLLARADGSGGITAALRARHAAEKKAERTGDPFPVWRRNFVEQVAAAWFLSIVFARTLEDRGLLDRNRIAGEGALDAQKTFFALAPSLGERDYLLTVFKELSHLVAADLFDAHHNPVWLFGPSAEAAQRLLQLFRTPSAEAPTFRFGGDSRFLGDLYQDLSENVRKRYALLQTPRFVERFILDRTLEPAIERFGIDQVRLIDPTCGSGHFLLGAFERLFDRHLEAAPGLDVREAARRALEAVAGADINPYAVAIARFRLTLAFLERTGTQKLKNAPRLPLHLAVADSLLHNRHKGLDQRARDSAQYQQTLLGELPGTDISKWEGELYALEDSVATHDVLGKRYAVVVGNPPYITVKDAVLREKYRKIYSTAFRSYSLAVPFKECFFQLGRQGASVGMITANSFMKREFGKKLIEEFIPRWDLTHVIDTSGAYIPGHGTPTVILLGRNRLPLAKTVRAVMGIRGEPETPEDPAQGQVWTAIVSQLDQPGSQSDYVSAADAPRDSFHKHPWSLGGGGAA
ncbi:MAG TPA: BREX-2 system adenine-specific DNA-methyltransferase PglX, partial [Polyangiaceae bacterium]